MKLREIMEMSTPDIEDVELKIRKSFNSVGIIINFTKHFGDRIVNNAEDEKGRKRDNISPEELLNTFDRLKDHHKQIFAEAHQFTDEVKRGEFEGVIMDIFKKINVPFALEFDKRKGKFILTCKTIMKRDNFITKSKDHVITLREK
jgi:hypothetical protein